MRHRKKKKKERERERERESTEEDVYSMSAGRDSTKRR